MKNKKNLNESFFDFNIDINSSKYYSNLTLRKINRLRKISILKKVEFKKRSKLLRKMYGKESENAL
jgi:hypothetical protein